MKKTISFKRNIEFPTMIGEVTAISLDHNLKFIDECNIIGEFKVTGRYKMTEASILEEEFNHSIPVEILLTEKLELETAKVDIEDFYYEIEDDDTMICYIDVKIEGVELIEELDRGLDFEPDEIETPNRIDDAVLENISVSKDERCVEAEEPLTSITPPIEEKGCIEPEEELPKDVTDNIKEKSLIQDEVTKEERNLETNGEMQLQKKLEQRVLPKEEKTCDDIRECDDDYNFETESEKMKEEANKKEANDSKREKEETTIIVDGTSEEVGSLFSSFKDSDETFATYSVYIIRQEETIQTVIEKYHTTKEDLEKYNDLTNLTIGTKIIIPTVNE